MKYTQLNFIVGGTEDKNRVQEILSGDIAETLRETAFAPEGGFPIVGTKTSVIRALAIVDAEAAYTAALRALQHTESRDRDHYPALLVELKNGRAIPDLFGQMRVETSSLVRAAIGRALRTQNVHPLLSEWAEAMEKDRRQTACLIARYQAPTHETFALVISLLTDVNAQVFEAAVEALLELRRTTRQNELLASWHETAETARRWLLMDMALSVGDLGDANTLWREELASAHRICSPPVKYYIEEVVHDRRKELQKQLAEQDRNM